MSFGTRRLKIFANIKGKGDLIAVTGYLKTRSYIDKENIVRNIVEVIVEQVDYLGYTKRGVDKSEPIPKLDPDHKKQEEYQMIHDALCADEDLPF
ncbi:MAG: single-stranded DNA-binding protein [Ruminococcus sp.]